MTMRLDIVTNDAGELVRREHARELGAGVLVAIYRLVKLAQMHDLGNQALVRAIDQAHQIIVEYGLRAGVDVNVLFADRATFVAGQLMKGNRSAYEAATELGDLFLRLGGAELLIARDVTREDCAAFAEQVSLYHRTGNASQLRLPTRIRLRHVPDNARLRGIELENLSPDQRIVRTYASAVVIMRRFFEDLAASRYVLPRRIKRIAQSLVDLSDAAATSFLGVTEVRNANHDEAGRAVNSAILAVAIARESTQDRGTLAQIAMAAIMHDVARPRAIALAGAAGGPMPGMSGPTTLSEDQEDRLPAGAAAVLTALGRVNEPTITRTVLAFEALWLRRQSWLGAVYWGARPPTLHATIIAVARRYNDLLTPEPGLLPPTTDFAIATLANELTDSQDRTVLRMLVSALGLLPTGTLVQLSSGEVAEVSRGARGIGDRPAVRIVSDAKGAALAEPVDIDLAYDARRVHRVLSVDGWQKRLAEVSEQLAEAPDSEPDIHVSMAPMGPSTPPGAVTPEQGMLDGVPAQDGKAGPAATAAVEESPEAAVAWSDPAIELHTEAEDGPSSSSGVSVERASSVSRKSFGSSPSAVAEAMGKMLHDSLAPAPVAGRPSERPDRTVVQPHGVEEARSVRLASTAADDPTARGTLAVTPLPHVLVYMLDHALTGSVLFEGTRLSDDAADDTIYFVNGVPAKVRLARPTVFLGELLADDGLLPREAIDTAVQGSSRLGILFGEFLVGHDLVTRDALAWALEGQLLRRVGQLANLAPELEYSFFRDVDLLHGWGGEVVVSHPLNPILASVRQWGDRARIQATLARIGKHALVLHADSDLTNVAVPPEELVVLEAIQAETMTLGELLERQLASEPVVASLVYSLAVTRQFAFKGQKRGPMAARGPAWRSVSPGSPSTAGMRVSIPVAAPSAPSLVPAPIGAHVASPANATSVPAAASALAHAAAPPAPPPPAPPAPAAPSSASLLASPAPGRPRPIAPAARPGAAPGGRASAPQIRPIARRGESFAKVQAAAAPSERSVAAARPPPSTEADGEAADDAKTIALASPGAKLALPIPRGVAAAARSSGNVNVGKPLPLPSASRLPAIRPATAASSAPASASESTADPLANIRLADSALQRNDLGAAETHVAAALAVDPSGVDGLLLATWISVRRGTAGSIEGAIATVANVLLSHPGHQRALLYRGKLYLQANRPTEALADFKALLQANPQHREAQDAIRQLAGRFSPA